MPENETPALARIVAAKRATRRAGAGVRAILESTEVGLRAIWLVLLDSGLLLLRPATGPSAYA